MPPSRRAKPAAIGTPYLADFINMMKAERNASRHTVEAYANDIAQFFLYLHRRKYTVEQVTTHDIEKYLATLTRTQKLSSTSCSRKLSAVRHFFKFLASEKIIGIDPAVGVDSPRMKKSLPHTLSEEDVLKLIATSEADTSEEGVRMNALLQILYASGLRVSELVGLKLGQIHIADREGLQTAFLLVKGKGGKERVVPLHDAAIRALYQYLRVRKFFLTGKESDWLFPSRAAEGHLTRQRFGQLLKELALAANMDPALLHPHALRHSFASHLLAGGADLRVVQELLGHADIATTQIYTHVLQERLEQLVHAHHPLAKM